MPTARKPAQTLSKVAPEPGRKPKPKSVRSPAQYDLLPDLIGYGLRRAQLAVFQHFARTMGEAMGADRISPGEFGVLVLIDANPAINQTALAEAVGADRSTMVPILDRLERRGLIERRAVPGDRRAHALALGEVGRRRMEEFRATVREHEKRIGNGLSADERATLIDLLGRLRKAAETA
jgi:DNA-binding MarR family transcriptional regulator